MLHLLRNGQVYLWGPVLPIAAGIVTDGVLQWHSAAHSPTAAPSASLWRQKAALASTAVLPESAAADAVDSRLLMGRGDPRTKRGKVSQLSCVALGKACGMLVLMRLCLSDLCHRADSLTCLPRRSSRARPAT